MWCHLTKENSLLGRCPGIEGGRAGARQGEADRPVGPGAGVRIFLLKVSNRAVITSSLRLRQQPLSKPSPHRAGCTPLEADEPSSSPDAALARLAHAKRSTSAWTRTWPCQQDGTDRRRPRFQRPEQAGGIVDQALAQHGDPMAQPVPHLRISARNLARPNARIRIRLGAPRQSREMKRRALSDFGLSKKSCGGAISRMRPPSMNTIVSTTSRAKPKHAARPLWWRSIGRERHRRFIYVISVFYDHSGDSRRQAPKALNHSHSMINQGGKYLKFISL